MPHFLINFRLSFLYQWIFTSVLICYQAPLLAQSLKENEIKVIDKRTERFLVGIELSEKSPFGSEIQIRDLQYDKPMSFRVIDVLLTLRIAARKVDADLANLIFDNGMIIPVLLNSPALEHLYVAYQVKQDVKGKWSEQFPVISKPSSRWRDPRPIKFEGNKLIVNRAVISALAFPLPEGEFQPFKHISALKRIELVDSSIWKKQFAVATPNRSEHRIGQMVFLQRCQYCHGVQGVGASFGWDFVEPLALYEKRPANSLFQHVKFPKSDRLERGLMMPHQTGLKEHEAATLWSWMKAITKQKPMEYRNLIKAK